MDSRGFYEKSEDLFSYAPHREARIEAAFWIVEERRARLRGEPTEEAFARLAFQHCMQQTDDIEFR